ncbi:MAG: M48 family metallopeptidase [Solirubrobacteraceae bacterium]
MTEIAYRIRRSDRARRVRVTVDPEQGVEVVLPLRAREGAARSAVRELAPWIERQQRKQAEARAHVAASAGSVPYLGQELRLVPDAGRARVHRRGDELLVPTGDHRPAVERWYRRRAHAEVVPRLDVACAALERPYTRLTIRGQRTRWASCSADGAMSFNWRLLLAPEEVLDYVVWHEACHLIVRDHSARFWSLVAQHRPGYRAQVAWLRRHGAGLHL